jgi:acid phosphatase family membrane protein YuiD
MNTLTNLAITFQALGGMSAVDSAALAAYDALVDAVESFSDHETACAAVYAIVPGFDY